MLKLVKKYKKTAIGLLVTGAAAIGFTLKPEVADLITELLNALGELSQGLESGTSAE